MSKADLVDQIKALQRSGLEAKEAWWAFCDESLGGVRDPNRHDEETLMDFIATRSSSGSLLPPMPPRAGFRPPPIRSSPPQPNPGTSFHNFHAPRTTQFLPAQSSSFGGKGARPAVHPAPQQFMQAVVMPNTGQSDIVNWIKLGQRASGQWKAAWAMYCGLYGQGVNDPARHEEQHLVGFADYLGQLAMADLEASGAFVSRPPLQAPLQAPKRHGPAPGGMWAGASPPPMKRQRLEDPGQDLVGRVKAVQRRNPDSKQAWQDFCDAHPTLSGIKDPAKHGPADLEAFLIEYE